MGTRSPKGKHIPGTTGVGRARSALSRSRRFPNLSRSVWQDRQEPLGSGGGEGAVGGEGRRGEGAAALQHSRGMNGAFVLLRQRRYHVNLPRRKERGQLRSRSRIHPIPVPPCAAFCPGHRQGTRQIAPEPGQLAPPGVGMEWLWLCQGVREQGIAPLECSRERSGTELPVPQTGFGHRRG